MLRCGHVLPSVNAFRTPLHVFSGNADLNLFFFDKLINDNNLCLEENNTFLDQLAVVRNVSL